jgi:uncharacterized SAM-binding protein YcdF (DUF218 family)
MFIVSKIGGFLTLPSNLLLIAGLFGFLLLFTRYMRFGRVLVGLMVVSLGAFGLTGLGNVLIRPLEDRFPAWDQSRGAPTGIIILGGSISPDVSRSRGEVALNEAAERLTIAAKLARQYPDARIIFTGGNGDTFATQSTEADFALLLLMSFGIPREQILVEDRSRTTLENALFTKRLVNPKPGERWLLVTSAYHMPRAMGVFRKADFTVEAYPVDWRVGDPVEALPFDKVSDGLKRSDTAIHEWVGLVGYFLTGRSADLFPAPR